MILKKLIIDNVGLYSTCVEFSLSPNIQDNRSIILIGGKNGSGKTTFLETIRLALYGKRALGLGITQKDYEQYLKDKINQNNNRHDASIELSFIYTEANLPVEYTIKRTWKLLDNNKLVETLDLKKNNETVTSVPKQEWSNFLLELIPIGVSQLFFFDGEKIQDIAEDNNLALSDSVKSLLGIDLIEKLKLDLNSYLNRNKSAASLQNQDNAQQALERANEKLKILVDEKAKLKFQHHALLKDIEQQRLRFISEGGAIALEYDQLKAKLSSINKEINQCKHELVSLANNLLPFLFAPKLLGKFKQELKNIASKEASNISEDSFIEKLEIFKSSQIQKNASWLEDHWNDLYKFTETHFRNPSFKLPHPALNDLNNIESTLEQILNLDKEVRNDVQRLYKHFVQLNQDKEATEFSISRAENSGDSNIYLDELLAKERKVGELDTQLTIKEEEYRKLSWEIVNLERQLRAIIEDNAEIEQQTYKNSLAAKSIKVLIDFETRLLEQKILQVRKTFVEIFNALLRKHNFITDIHIDPKTFSTSLISSTGKVVYKHALSAGEKQIYAIAMLWSLAKTSGRNLPMIVDTPLGRLDREHRNNLMKYYFPHVSHQVIILSTDTEIDELYAEQLKEHVAESYLLDYNFEKGSTEVKAGYFVFLKHGNLEKRIALQQA